MNKYISIGKVSEMLGVSTQAIRDWGKNGKLMPIKHPSRNRMYNIKDVEALIEPNNTNEDNQKSTQN